MYITEDLPYDSEMCFNTRQNQLVPNLNGSGTSSNTVASVIFATTTQDERSIQLVSEHLYMELSSEDCEMVHEPKTGKLKTKILA